MNKSRKAFSVPEARIKASILLKSLRSSDLHKAKNAAKRFQRLPELAMFSAEEILQLPIKLKQALSLIAIENGFKSWLALKTQTRFIVGGYLNVWFADYPQAKTNLQSTGGFLLPYKNQFFICNATYMQQIGFDPNDPDWQLIGYDWVNPENKDAHKRLYKKWVTLLGDPS